MFAVVGLPNNPQPQGHKDADGRRGRVESDFPVTFGGELDYRTERIVFDVVDLPLPYNGILGCPALAKFMAASHYAYNTLKMPLPLGLITIPLDEKDAIICVDKMYQEAVVVEAAAGSAPAKESEGKKRD